MIPPPEGPHPPAPPAAHTRHHRVPRPVLLLLAFILLAVAANALLQALRPDSAWLRLKAPPAAVRGVPLPVEVQLLQPPPGHQLAVNLHAASTGERRSTVINTPQVPQPAHPSTFHLEIPFRAEPSQKSLRVVVFLSPDGRWQNRSHAAISDEIRILDPDDPRSARPRKAVRHRLEEASRASVIPRTRNNAIRATTAGLWCLAGCQVLRRSRNPRSAGFWLATTLLGMAVAEGVDLAGWAGERARSLASSMAAYDRREPPQQWTAAALLAGAAFAALRLLLTKRPWPRRIGLLAVLGGGLGLGVDAVSLHAIDEIIETSRLGLPAIQAWMFGCALAGFIGLGIATGNPSAGAPASAGRQTNR